MGIASSRAEDAVEVRGALVAIGAGGGIAMSVAAAGEAFPARGARTGSLALGSWTRAGAGMGRLDAYLRAITLGVVGAERFEREADPAARVVLPGAGPTVLAHRVGGARGVDRWRGAVVFAQRDRAGVSGVGYAAVEAASVRGGVKATRDDVADLPVRAEDGRLIAANGRAIGEVARGAFGEIERLLAFGPAAISGRMRVAAGGEEEQSEWQGMAHGRIVSQGSSRQRMPLKGPSYAHRER